VRNAAENGMLYDVVAAIVTRAVSGAMPLRPLQCADARRSTHAPLQDRTCSGHVSMLSAWQCTPASAPKYLSGGYLYSTRDTSLTPTAIVTS